VEGEHLLGQGTGLLTTLLIEFADICLMLLKFLLHLFVDLVHIHRTLAVAVMSLVVDLLDLSLDLVEEGPTSLLVLFF